MHQICFRLEIREIMAHSMNRRKDRKQVITEAAARVFAQEGYAGASVADIAKAADVGKGTIYEYFRSKDELFFAVFEWFMQKTGAAAKASISAIDDTAAQRLTALNDAVMSQWDQLRDGYTLVMEFWAASSSSQMRDQFRKVFKQGYRDFREIVASLIADGVERGEFRPNIDSRAIASSLVGTWDALLLQAWFDSSFDPLAAARQFLQVVLRGLSSE